MATPKVIKKKEPVEKTNRAVVDMVVDLDLKKLARQIVKLNKRIDSIVEAIDKSKKVKGL